jgi:aryl-alcohol dehydrogenase-like predicted oxidoreductase
MRLGLGTAQFGSDYGISHFRGRPTREEVKIILEEAARFEIDLIDTAAAYGDAEEILGDCLPINKKFKVVTKLMPLNRCSNPGNVSGWIHKSINASLQNLQMKSVFGLLVHHTADLLGPHGDDVYSELLKLKKDGLVDRIGLSAYSGEQIDTILDRYKIDLIQIPLNVFDQRLIVGGQLQRLQNSSVEIHVRSIFLQGLLLMRPSDLPPNLFSLRPALLSWREELKSLNLTPAQGAFAFAKSLNVDAIIIGVQNIEQLNKNNLDFTFSQGKLVNFCNYAVNDNMIIDPSNWKK